MKNITLRDHALELYLRAYSLKDLLGILKDICEHTDFINLNPNLKYFKQFRFTFFGLMIKANSLLEMMVYKCEFLKENIDNESLVYLYLELVRLKTHMEKAYNLVFHKKLYEGKNVIIESAKSYDKLFQNIQKIFHKVI